MKKTAILLCCTLLICMFAAPASLAADAEQEKVQMVISALSIMSGDENGNLNLDNSVTRAEFAKMMVMASKYKDSVSETSNVSPFKDVPYTHWAASYVKIAAENKWVTGYLDGTYRPNKNITLEEAVNASLKLLGYESSDFQGSYPDAQLSLYSSLNLSENISAVKGSYISRRDCMNLFYNLLNTKPKGGTQSYVASLGYSVGTDGKLDYTKIINETMDGPYVIKNGISELALPFSTANATIYRNGYASSASAIVENDIVYYSKSLRTIWAYANSVTGTYESASPNTDYPTSVVVAGTSYEISSSNATYALSSAGTFKTGDSVTLILGKDKTVVSAVVPNASQSGVVVGIVSEFGSKNFTNANGTSSKSNYIKVMATSGSEIEYKTENTYSVGNVVKITTSDGETKISRVSASLSGTFDSEKKSLGSYSYAEDIGILETDGNAVVKIYPRRLNGLSISSDKVLYYALENGKLTHLVLKNVTGDASSYGVITQASTTSGGSLSVNGSYTYDIAGKTYQTSGSTILSASGGAVKFILKDGKFQSAESLTLLSSLSEVNASYLVANGKSYPISEKVAVYIYKNSAYSYTSLSEVLQGQYVLRAYYDKESSEGGRIRVIIATEE